MRRAWFTADQHFFHEQIIAHNSRPFATVEEMNAELISRWNEVVSTGDEVFMLGDFVWTGVADAFEIFNKLNGRIFILEGNHDRKWWGKTAYYSKPGYRVEPIPAQYVFKFRRPRPSKIMHITLSHYAMRTWYRAHHGAWHLYGHSHGRLDPMGKSFDVGVDNWDYYPISLTQVMDVMDQLPRALHELMDDEDIEDPDLYAPPY